MAFPSIAHTPAAFAVIGMAAAFAAIVRAPLTGIVLILEMTNNYEQLFPLLVACMIAFLVAERLHNKPIYEALLEYDLERTGFTEHPQAAEPVTMELAVEPHSPMDGPPGARSRPAGGVPAGDDQSRRAGDGALRRHPLAGRRPCHRLRHRRCPASLRAGAGAGEIRGAELNGDCLRIKRSLQSSTTGIDLLSGRIIVPG